MLVGVLGRGAAQVALTAGSTIVVCVLGRPFSAERPPVAGAVLRTLFTGPSGNDVRGWTIESLDTARLLGLVDPPFRLPGDRRLDSGWQRGTPTAVMERWRLRTSDAQVDLLVVATGRVSRPLRLSDFSDAPRPPLAARAALRVAGLLRWPLR